MVVDGGAFADVVVVGGTRGSDEDGDPAGATIQEQTDHTQDKGHL